MKDIEHMFTLYVCTKEDKKKHAVLGLARMSASMCQKEGCPERIGIGLVCARKNEVEEL
jgi:hypothetical protein